jgi:hypothetical protein
VGFDEFDLLGVQRLDRQAVVTEYQALVVSVS